MCNNTRSTTNECTCHLDCDSRLATPVVCQSKGAGDSITVGQTPVFQERVNGQMMCGSDVKVAPRSLKSGALRQLGSRSAEPFVALGGDDLSASRQAQWRSAHSRTAGKGGGSWFASRNRLQSFAAPSAALGVSLGRASRGRADIL